jgi:hypothetical protein
MPIMLGTYLIGAGAAADPDPRANPELVPPDRVLVVGDRIPQTDEQGASLALALEGTAANTCVLTIYACFDDRQQVAPKDQRWYILNSAGITVTVGTIMRAPALPCTLYLRVTTASAAASTLKALVLSVPYATPVA